MRDAARGALIGLAVLLVGAAVLHRLDLASLPRAAGPHAWFLTRATGITALVALSLDVALGLLMSTRRTGGTSLSRGDIVALHQWLSPIALALVAGHAGVLLLDGYIGFDAVDVVVPFAARWRPFAIGLGTIAAYLAFVVHASFGFRKRIGTRWWRRVHYASFVAFTAAVGHALLAGTDTFRPWALAIMAPPVLAIVVLVGLRARA